MRQPHQAAAVLLFLAGAAARSVWAGGQPQWGQRHSRFGMKPSPRKTQRARDFEKACPRAAFVADALAAGRPFTLQVAGGRLRNPAGAPFNPDHERKGKTEKLEFQLCNESAVDCPILPPQPAGTAVMHPGLDRARWRPWSSTRSLRQVLHLYAHLYRTKPEPTC